MEFRSLACLVLALVVTSGAAAAPPPADTVFVNGAVYTVDPAHSWAAAVAVRGGRIEYVGTDAGAKPYVGPRTRVIDLEGRMLLPGFRDSHVHPQLAPNPATQLNVTGLTTPDAIVSKIGDFAQAHASKPWVVGTGWAEAAFLPSGLPTRQQLDAAVGERPTFLTNNSQHMAWVSSAALAAASITAATPDPPNGHIVKDAAGRPTGVLQEAAMALVHSVIPPPTTAERATDLAASIAEMHRNGITSMEEAAARPPMLPGYAALAGDGRLGMRTRICQYFDPAGDDATQLREFIAQRAAFGNGAARADCVKIVLDGSYGSHTVALLEPYSDEPERFGTGKLFLEPERLNRLVTRLDREGFHVHIHTIGDKAVRTALDAYAAARRSNGVHDARHTLVHLSLVSQDDLRRFRELDVVANMSPLWSHGNPWETVFGAKMFGEQRAVRYRTRSLLDQGTVVAFGSDWPVSSVSPLEGIEVAVTHRHPGGRDENGKVDQTWLPQERITLAEAITGYTAAGAYLAHEEFERGTIRPGYAADIVVLASNLFDVEPLAIHAVPVDLTMVGGKVVYERRREVR